jgi:hypothetical protein
MKIHLVTVVGYYVKQLPHMLNHYRKLGVDSFIINVHLQHEGDPILSEVKQIVSGFGCGIASVTVGRWSNALLQRLYNRSRSGGADDWFLLADLDEFHVYPSDLFSIIDECEKKGYNYIRGCFIDRIAADGGFPELRPDRPIEDQLPLGCMFTYSILQGNPIKVVAAKRQVILGPGNHSSMNGVGCPITECFVQIHHYKWVREIVKQLEYRANREWEIHQYVSECQRFVEYYRANNGRIDITAPELLVAECRHGYKHWEYVKKTALSLSYPFDGSLIAR